MAARRSRGPDGPAIALRRTELRPPDGAVRTDEHALTHTLALFNEVRNLRIAANKSTDLDWGSGHCEIDFSSDPYLDRDEHHTVRAWIAVLAYLLSDRRFLYE